MEDKFSHLIWAFEYKFMSFALTNAPRVFQHMANDIIQDFLDVFPLIYLDDLLIYSKTQEGHNSNVLQALKHYENMAFMQN